MKKKRKGRPFQTFLFGIEILLVSSSIWSFITKTGRPQDPFLQPLCGMTENASLEDTWDVMHSEARTYLDHKHRLHNGEG